MVEADQRQVVYSEVNEWACLCNRNLSLLLFHRICAQCDQMSEYKVAHFTQN